MTRTTAIEKVRDILNCLRKEICTKETAAYAVLHISTVSGVPSEDLVKDAETLLMIEIELNTIKL